MRAALKKATPAERIKILGATWRDEDRPEPGQPPVEHRRIERSEEVVLHGMMDAIREVLDLEPIWAPKKKPSRMQIFDSVDGEWV